MKSVIVTASVHHGNTRKVVDAIANEFEVDVIDDPVYMDLTFISRLSILHQLIYL